MLNKSLRKGHFSLVLVLRGTFLAFCSQYLQPTGKAGYIIIHKQGSLSYLGVNLPCTPTFSFMMLYNTYTIIPSIFLHLLKLTSFIHQIFVEH